MLDQPYNVLITGVGGTGVVTIGALMGMAAHIEGKGVIIMDMAGLAQKGGAVMSHVRLAARPESLHGARVGQKQADLLLACDFTPLTQLATAVVQAALQHSRVDPARVGHVVMGNVIPTDPKDAYLARVAAMNSL